MLEASSLKRTSFKATPVCVWALCILFAHQRACAAPTVLPAQETGAAQEFTAGKTQPAPPLKRASRVKINLKTQELTFAKENEVPIDLHGNAVRQITAAWRSLWEWDASETPVVLRHAQDGSTYVDVVPTRLGKLKLVLGFLFEDCGYEEEVVDVNVRPPDQEPEKFILASRSRGGDYTSKAGTVHLDFADFSGLVLTPVAFYKGSDSPVPVFEDDVVFTVITKKSEESPVAFDPTMRAVKPVKVGQALIKATFRGRSAYACVDVMRDARQASGRSDCHDFLPPDLTEPIDEDLKSGPLPGASPQPAADANGTHELPAGAWPVPQNGKEDRRVKIELKTPDMKLAQDNQVPLNLQGNAVLSVSARWTPYSQAGVLDPGFEDSGAVPLHHAQDGSTYVDVVPTKLGKLRLGLLFTFGDCVLGNTYADVSVHLPDRDPARLILADPAVTVDYTRKAGTLHLDLSPQFSKELLTLVAFYKGVDYPVPITTGHDVVFSVIPRKNQPSPIVYDASTGEVKALKFGQALIKATLRGKSAYACVDVMRDAREFMQRSNCNDFLPPDLTETIDEPMQMPEPVQPN